MRRSAIAVVSVAGAAGLIAASATLDHAQEAPGAATVYSANSSGDSVSVLDAGTLAAVHADIAVGGGAVGTVAVSPDGSRVYVGDSNGGVTQIDTATNEVAGRAGLGETAVGDLVVSPDSTRIYATLPPDGAVAVLSASPFQMTGTFPVQTISSNSPSPQAIDISSDGAALFVLNSSAAEVVKMSTADGSTLDSVGVSPNARELKVSAGGGTVIVVGPDGPEFFSASALDPLAGAFTADLGTQTDLAVAGASVYVLNEGFIDPQPADSKGGPKGILLQPSIDVYDAASGDYVESLLLGLGSNVLGIAVLADGSRAFVSRDGAENLGDVSSVDLADGTVTATGQTGAGPRRLAIRAAGPPVIDSFFLPKKVAYKKNSAAASRSVFKANGFFDTGSRVVVLTDGATLTVGTRPFVIPSLTAAPNGRTFTYSQGGLKLVVVKNPFGSSRAKFRLTFVGDLGTDVPTEGNVDLRFQNDAVDGFCTVLLAEGGFRLGRKRGALSQPNLFVVRAAADVPGNGRDTLSLIVGLATGGSTPATPSEVRVQFGDGLDATIPAAEFERKGDTYVFKGDIGGVTDVTVDYVRETVSIQGKNLSLGTFAAGQTPLQIFVGVGAEDRGVAVRVARQGNVLKY